MSPWGSGNYSYSADVFIVYGSDLPGRLTSAYVELTYGVVRQ